MTRLRFDSDKYSSMQTQKLLKRIASFGERLYLEIEEKHFNDCHVSRILPFSEPKIAAKIPI